MAATAAERSRRYRLTHRDVIAEYNRQWRAKHKAERAEYGKRWRQENRETMNEIAHRYRQRNRLAIMLSREMGLPMAVVRERFAHMLNPNQGFG